MPAGRCALVVFPLLLHTYWSFFLLYDDNECDVNYEFPFFSTLKH
ncbi:hypothetical protein GTCCBUS3UF5_4910 [Geobacillus thermoleovorans CCB_US3_UF5]|uniref:Uncharacterized protein n=1 Tax=Geobacillus thermoleovorans CCB_US3_UF5 TaxID=1111068 RepID=A0ABN3ZQ98_GEOTH|nr:hypothetical protein GTCCBUS3UF5_4910 [Geobacillus thermoleovorans CCB_US3_UF5]GAJ60449.1 hypothetical protein B23_3694 [Geobacillus thermoleovorans B23]